MTITANIVPFEQVFGLDGKPLDSGQIYIGLVNQDPQYNQVQVYWDEAGTITAAQPIRTVAGYISYNGAPARIYVNGNYSLKVLTKNSEQVYYVPDYLAIGNQDALTPQTGMVRIAEYATLRAYSAPVTLVYVAGRTNDQDGAAGNFAVDEADATSADNDGTIIVDALGRRWKRQAVQDVNPAWFGAIGDGANDDTAALNATFNYFRSLITTNESGANVNGNGKTYRCTGSINATLINSWGWAIKNMTIASEATNKIAFDMIGSRGGALVDFVVYGHKINRPSIGIMAARAVSAPFCDNMLFDNVTTNGWFGSAGAYLYGQETTLYDHCRFWNYDKAGFAAIHTGIDKFSIPWEFTQPITGATSYINCQYNVCDWRYLPIDRTCAITAITKANPCVVTVTGNVFSVGDSVSFGLVGGMAELNNTQQTITAINGNNLTLGGVNSTAYNTYTGGGYAFESQQRATIYLGRGEQHHFDTCYVVAYGQPSLQIDNFDNTHSIKSIWLDMLFEGAASPCHVYFSGITTPKSINDFKLNTYNIHAKDYIIGSSGGNNSLSFYDFEVCAQNNSTANSPLLFDDVNKYGLFNADISIINQSQFDPATRPTQFVGSVSYLSGATVQKDVQIISGSDGQYTPTVAAASGTITTFTVSGTSHRTGNYVFVTILLTITANGTGANAITVTLPSNVKNSVVFAGRENGVSGKMLQGIALQGSNSLRITDYANAYPLSGATGTIFISGGYMV